MPHSPLPPPDPRLDLVLERVVDVPVERVWAAWTTPDQIKQWFTPAPWTTVDCEIDLVPGGIFRTVMRSPEGQEYPNLGCWLEVVPNERLVWTNVFEPGYRPTRHASGADCDEFPFTAVVAMAPHGSGTWYTARVIHGTEDARRRHADMGFHDGWGAALDQLVAMIRHGSAARTSG
ncbi:MAG: SRPBCC family protein [Burkholderiales bacterium]|nr:SRPBCC family protein [Burkholderiales bacterium]